MAVVLVAYSDRDLCEFARDLNKGFGGVVEPVNFGLGVQSPDLVRLRDGASAHFYLDKRCLLNFGEGVSFGIESPGDGMVIDAKNLVSSSRNTRKSACDLLKMLC